MLRIFIALSFFIVTFHASAKWERVKIPGAYCGSGAPYSIFVNLNNRDEDKLAIEFMGGGACWSAGTCIGPKTRTWIYPIPNVQYFSHFNSSDFLNDRLSNYQKVYLPYCTGDVFAANHVAKYGVAKIFHTGKRNVYLAMKYLHERRLISFRALNDVILYGASAGAIGAVFNMPLLNRLTKYAENKTLIADAPGLHFGETFWEKFPKALITAFRKNFSRIGLKFDRSTGFVGRQFPRFCHKYRNWKIGVLQGSRDIIMASLFGNITPDDHEKRVYSEDGIYQNTKNIQNCSVWAPSTLMHTFLLAPISARKDYTTISAEEFTVELLSGHTNRNYK